MVGPTGSAFVVSEVGGAGSGEVSATRYAKLRSFLLRADGDCSSIFGERSAVSEVGFRGEYAGGDESVSLS